MPLDGDQVEPLWSNNHPHLASTFHHQKENEEGESLIVQATKRPRCTQSSGLSRFFDPLDHQQTRSFHPSLF